MSAGQRIEGYEPVLMTRDGSESLKKAMFSLLVVKQIPAEEVRKTTEKNQAVLWVPAARAREVRRFLEALGHKTIDRLPSSPGDQRLQRVSLQKTLESESDARLLVLDSVATVVLNFLKAHTKRRPAQVVQMAGNKPTVEIRYSRRKGKVEAPAVLLYFDQDEILGWAVIGDRHTDYNLPSRSMGFSPMKPSDVQRVAEFIENYYAGGAV